MLFAKRRNLPNMGVTPPVYPVEGTGRKALPCTECHYIWTQVATLRFRLPYLNYSA